MRNQLCPNHLNSAMRRCCSWFLAASPREATVGHTPTRNGPPPAVTLNGHEGSGRGPTSRRVVVDEGKGPTVPRVDVPSVHGRTSRPEQVYHAEPASVSRC